jgi:thiol-disulfide isomerase/thioredoxin
MVMLKKILAIALVIIIGLWGLSVAIQTITINNLANSKQEKPCPIIIVNRTVNATVKPTMSIIYFNQDGCEYCAAQNPAIQDIAKTHMVTVINLTTNSTGTALIKQWDIKTTPTTIILKNGKEVKRFDTVQSEATILGSLNG